MNNVKMLQKSNEKRHNFSESAILRCFNLRKGFIADPEHPNERTSERPKTKTSVGIATGVRSFLESDLDEGPTDRTTKREFGPASNLLLSVSFCLCLVCTWRSIFFLAPVGRSVGRISATQTSLPVGRSTSSRKRETEEEIKLGFSGVKPTHH